MRRQVIDVDFDFATLSSPICSCILFCHRFEAAYQTGISVSNLNCRIEINPVKQPIQSNSVGSWHMSHCWTSSFDYHLNNGFIVLKDHSIGTRMCSAWWNVINVGQIEMGVRGWNLFLRVWLSVCRQVSPWLSCIFGFIGLVQWKMKYFKH